MFGLKNIVKNQKPYQLFPSGQASSYPIAQHIKNRRRYAVVVDVGSTGTRSHVFEWTYVESGCNNKGAVHIQLPEKSAKLRPGLTTFLQEERLKRQLGSVSEKQTAVDTSGNWSSIQCGWCDAYTSLDVINYFASVKANIDKFVPHEKRATTRVWILGTAGLRYLNSQFKHDMLNVVRQYLKRYWEYKTHPSWVYVLTGVHEGLYSWVLLNQVLGRCMRGDTGCENLLLQSTVPETPFAPAHTKLPCGRDHPTAALVEIGGASAQIVFEPSKEVTDKLPPPPKEITSTNITSAYPVPNTESLFYVNFCGRTSVVYSESFAAFGRQLALQRYTALGEALKEPQTVPTGLEDATRIPCLPPDVIFPKTSGTVASLTPLENIGVIIDKSLESKLSLQINKEKKKSEADVLGNAVLGIRDGTAADCMKALDETVFWSESKGQNDGQPRRNMTQHDLFVPWHPIPYVIDSAMDIVGNENLYFFHKLVALPPSHDDKFTAAHFRKRAEVLCHANSVEAIAKQISSKAELEKAKTACFGLSYMAEFLTHIGRVDENRAIQAMHSVEAFSEPETQVRPPPKLLRHGTPHGTTGSHQGARNVEVTWAAGFLLMELPLLLQRSATNSASQ